uniref:Amino_oxidase domain-containing protein n=1 Tax=Anopheles coluzzii TaxID=1518534 RepID=A0A6E8VRP1_ANOCL
MKYHPKFRRFIMCLLTTISLVNGARNPRVVVIGAGAAGLATASRLHQGGITNVTILEASQRVGGRIRTTPFGAGIVELGAQWCHGEKGNVVYELASAYPDLLKASIIVEDAALIQSNGVRIEDELVEKVSSLAEQISESEDRMSYAGSLGDFFTETYWQRLQTDAGFSDVGHELAEQFLVYFHNRGRGDSAYDSWYDVAANETDSYQETEGNQALAWNSRTGYSTILDIVSGNYPAAANSTNPTKVPLSELIVFGKYVSNIQWDGVHTNNVLITTEDGSQYKADHVVVTVSLGVLKENSATMFTPALPTVNQQAIEGLNFGTVNKIFTLYNAPLPEGMANSVFLLWHKPDLDALRRSKYAWAEAVAAFFRVDHQPNVLGAWLNGIEGRQAELLPDEVVQEGLAHLLEIFLPKLNFSHVQSIIRSKWSSDRLFRGSYSSRSTLTETLGTGAQYLGSYLANKDGTPVVMFAGEATNRFHFSTVHGAIESGFREADRVLDLYNGSH